MLKWLLILVGGLLIAIAAGLASLPFVLNTAALRAYIAHAASNAVARPVRFASLSVSAFPLPAVRLRGLEVAEDPAYGPRPFLTVGEGRIAIRLWPLLRGRVELATLTLDEPRIELADDGRGRWNWASLGVPAAGLRTTARGSGRARRGAPTALALSEIRVVNGWISYKRVGAAPPPLTFEHVDLTIRQSGLGPAFSVAGGAVLRPAQAKLSLRDVALDAAGARSLADTALRGAIDVEVSDVSSLAGLLIIAPAIAGAMKGRFDISGTAGALTARGALSLDRVTVSDDRTRCEPRRRQLLLSDVRAPMILTAARLDSAPIEVRAAGGRVSLKLGVTLGSPATALLEDIEVKGVELGPILLDFLCQPYAVTGALELTGEASARGPDPWRTMRGSGRFRIGRGKVVGAEVAALVRDAVTLAGAASTLGLPDLSRRAASPLDFDSISATYAIADGVVRTPDLVYRAPDVIIRAAGTVALYDGRVDMSLTLQQGRNQVEGIVSGTAGALRVVPTGFRVPEAREIKKLLERLLR
jgi:uncharacterized protein involved in outer membrane biogenesis